MNLALLTALALLEYGLARALPAEGTEPGEPLQTDRSVASAETRGMVIAPLSVNPAGPETVHVVWRPWHGPAAALGPVAYLLTIIWMRGKRVTRSRAEYRALRQAIRSVRNIGRLKRLAPQAAAAALGEAARAYVTARFGASTAALTPNEMGGALADMAGDAAAASEFCRLFERSFNVRYEPAAQGIAYDPSAEARAMETAIRRLEYAAQKKKAGPER